MGRLIDKFKGLSLVAKTAVILVGLGAVGAVAMPKPAVVPTASPEVEAAKTVITHETVTETEVIPFSKKTQSDGNLATGTSKVTVIGINGVKTLTYSVTKTDGSITDKQLTKAEVTTAPVDEMTNIGTYVAPAPAPTPAPAAAASCNPNYSPCVPNVSYDLDCPDIGFTVRVIGSDVYRLDRDKDGYGCE